MSDKILLVDDDEAFRAELRDFLEGYDVVEASNGRQALALLQRANEISLVVLDVMMPGLNGIDVLREIKRADPNLGIIILTAYGSKDTVIDALKGRADDYIEKPLDIDKVRDIIARVLDSRRNDRPLGASDIRDKIEKVKYFAQRNCYRKTALKDAALAVCLSPKYLSRIFKQKTGSSFSEYRLKIKIGKAKELLVKSGYNVNQVSEKLGYENVESFIRQFKKLAGCTPTKYRRKNMKNKSRMKKRSHGKKRKTKKGQ